MIGRWLGAAAVAVTAVTVAVITVLAGKGAVGLPLATVLLVFAWSVSPLLAPRGPGWAAAQKRACGRRVPLILWKPGCAYCIRLRLALGPRGSRAVWVDITADPAAAAALRAINSGDETTPTVITPSGAVTNPPPGFVSSVIAAA